MFFLSIDFTPSKNAKITHQNCCKVEEKLEAESKAHRESREAEKATLLAKRQEASEEIFRLRRRKTTTLIAEREIGHLRLLQNYIQTK